MTAVRLLFACWKNALVVSFSRISGCHLVTAATACARCVTALVSSGTDP
jgi:hypothetical protein